MDASHWITGIITLIVGIFGSTGFWTYKMSKQVKKSSETKMLMGLAYISIVRHCSTWIEQGWADTDEIGDLQKYLYEPYREAGGNGTAEMMMNKAKSLPNKPPKAKEENHE